MQLLAGSPEANHFSKDYEMTINKLIWIYVSFNTEATWKFGLRLIAFQIVAASLSYV